MTSSKKRTKPAGSLKAWTIACLVLVIAVALLLRGFVIYQFFPIGHQEQIEKSSAQYALDPYFVCALICAESGFNESAVSSQGAVGLMQILPETGEWAAEKIGIEGYSADRLSDPDINIEIGCWYLSYLSGLFDGDTEKMLAGYNAGPSRVQQWTQSDGSLGSIPFEETADYLVKVQRNYEIYKSIYNDF